MIGLPIETERLIIRPLRLTDAGEMDESADWISEKMDRFERDGGMSLWAVVERSTGRAAGLAGLQWEQIDGRRELDLGCVIAKDRRRLGYATEASRGVLDAALAAGYERITAMTLPDNDAALRALAKLEFLRRGETTFDGRLYAFFVRDVPGTPADPRASAAEAARPRARS